MSFWKRLSGKTVEDKVGEFGEIYGEVLLGLHRDTESVKTKVHTWQKQVEHAAGKLDEALGRLEALEREIGEPGSLRRAIERLDALERAAADIRRHLDELRSQSDEFRRRMEEMGRRLDELGREQTYRVTKPVWLISGASLLISFLVAAGVVLWNGN